MENQQANPSPFANATSYGSIHDSQACPVCGGLWPHAHCPGCGLLYGKGHLAQKQGDGRCGYCQRDAERAQGLSVRRE